MPQAQDTHHAYGHRTAMHTAQALWLPLTFLADCAWYGAVAAAAVPEADNTLQPFQANYLTAGMQLAPRMQRSSPGTVLH